MISVCIPTYNSVQFLGEAIDSVFAQEFGDWELVVCDNASTDETPQLCARYAGDPRFQYVRYDELVNQAANWNRCLALATRKHVALLHADDRYLPGFLGVRVAALEAHPEVGLAFGAVRTIDAEGRILGEKRLRAEAHVWPAPEFFGELLFGCVVSPVAPVVPRACYEAVGPFQTTRTWGVDWEMWLRLASRYAVAYDPEPHAEYRLHGASGTAAVMATARSSEEDYPLLQEIFGQIDARPELHRFQALRRPALRALALRMLYFGSVCCEQGHGAAARKHVRAALQADPAVVLRPTTWALALASVLGQGSWRVFRRLRGLPPATA